MYRCREKSTGLELAAKRIAIKRDADRHNVEQEVAIMQKMRHPRIAQIYDAFATKKNDIILIMEVYVILRDPPTLIIALAHPVSEWKAVNFSTESQTKTIF